MALLGVNEAHVQIATLRAASKDAPNVVSSNVRCRRQSEAVILMSLQLEHIGAGQGHYSQPFQLYNYALLARPLAMSYTPQEVDEIILRLEKNVERQIATVNSAVKGVA
ncbi:hypothetical protein AK812_SmicGene46136, partial [Symbiodinium microadriaticum]